MTKASDNVFPRFLVSEGGSTSTPASGRVTMYAKADGLMYSKDDAGTEKLMSSGGGGSGQGLIDYEFAARTSADITANSTSWANLDTGLDLVMTAASGDTIEVGCSGRWGSAGGIGILDVATLVGGSPVNYVSGTAGGASSFGILAWSSISGNETNIGGSHLYTLVSGDISSSTVTLRLRYRTSTAVNKTFYASANLPFHWWCKNIGPAM